MLNSTKCFKDTEPWLMKKDDYYSVTFDQFYQKIAQV